MFWFCSALSAAGILESVICSCLVAEFIGYWLHRLLHSDKLAWLSRNHMAHHLCFDQILHTQPTRDRPLNREGLALALQRYTLCKPLRPLVGPRTGERNATFQ